MLSHSDVVSRKNIHNYRESYLNIPFQFHVSERLDFPYFIISISNTENIDNPYKQNHFGVLNNF